MCDVAWCRQRLFGGGNRGMERTTTMGVKETETWTLMEDSHVDEFILKKYRMYAEKNGMKEKLN